MHTGDVLGACHAASVVAGSQVEPFLAASPTDPRFLVGAWQQDRFDAAAALGVAVTVSGDGGSTWSTAQLPYVTVCGAGSYRAVSDPEVGIGGDGRIYVSTIAFGASGQAVLVSSSGDRGRTWSHPVVVRGVGDDSAVLDKPALLVDRHRPGVVYEVWVEYPRKPGESLSALRVDEAFVSTSNDRGRTWSTPVRMYGSDSENQNHVPLELADGSLADVFAEAYRLGSPATTEELRVIRSTDEGRTWSAPVTAARFPFSTVAAGSDPHPVRASGQDVSAVAQGRFLYATWAYDTPHGSEIGVVRSPDDGRTWTREPDPVHGPVTAFLPQIAADARGDQAVTWYQTGGPRGDATTVEFAELAPGAGRWRVQEAMGPFDLRRAPPSPEGWFLGDYEGLAAAGCGFRLIDSVAGPDGSRAATTEVCPHPAG